MQIGGDDLNLPGPPKSGERAYILARIAEAWPQALCEPIGFNHRRGRKPPLLSRFSTNNPLGPKEELFIHRDYTSYLSWERWGLTDLNAGALITVFVDPDGFGFVVDSRQSWTGRLVEGIAVDILHRRG